MNILKWIQTSLKKLNTVRKLHMTQEEPIPTMSCTGVESQPAAAEKTSTGSQDSEPGRSSAGPTSASPSPKAPPNAAQAPATSVEGDVLVFYPSWAHVEQDVLQTDLDHFNIYPTSKGFSFHKFEHHPSVLSRLS